MTVITVPDNYGWVLAAATSYIFVNLWQGIVVSSKRKASKVLYPQAYAEKAQCDANKDALIFNCAQRAHQQTLEHLPSTIFATMFVGLRYPTVAAALGVARSLGRVLYTIGYVTGTPKDRYKFGGQLAPGAEYSLALASAWVAAELIMGKW